MVLVEWLGQVDYLQALDRQRSLVAERTASPDREDRLLLLEHPPTYTLGSSGDMRHLLVDETTLTERGIAVYQGVGRGGDITYHGPGQLVGYPILHLKRLYAGRGFARPDLHLYVREIETVITQVLAQFGVSGWHYDGYPGVWVDTSSGPCKIAAIGVRVSSKGISSHGFALNVNPDMRYFDHIVPCGIHQHGVTSLTQLLGREMTVKDLLSLLVEAFRHVFQVEASPIVFREPTPGTQIDVPRAACVES
ncbi:lipoyl(octanoyl) transferase LipB [candidate division KSB3 bacterium]|uniref:Octanoyltransferase n=1 Tax=candidate division KSB3 bacterium TaxID=2044937 RepID=A0A9D5Q7J1_9BACT|nr:lipoyl(octanoyl) transferase LipB [candidate division KSB3 bacterium]